MTVPVRRRSAVVHGLFFISGATALVYQVVWMRILVLALGATALAVSTVLTAFMAGLALGSFLLGRRADRGARPLRLYGWLEIGIGLYALLLPTLFSALVPVYRWIWLHHEPGLLSFALLKFAGSLLVLLLPTTLMGGTLPVLVRWATEREAVLGTRAGTLYAVNTAGAVVGTFLCGFVFIRTLGMQNTIWLAAAANLALGLAALLLSGRGEARATPALDPARVPRHEPAPRRRAAPLLLVYGASGFAALVLEVAWTRVLTLIIGGSVYAFSLMLTAFLIGLAAGAAALARIADRAGTRRGPQLLAGLLIGAGLAALGTVWLFGSLPYLFAASFRGILGQEVLATLLRFSVCTLVMFPATFLLGGIFPVVVRLYGSGKGGVGRSVGEIYAANTAGTIAGAFAGGFILVPLLGLQGTIVTAGGMEIILGTAVLLAAGPLRWRRLAAATASLVLLGAVITARPQWRTLAMNSGVYLYAAALPEKFDRARFSEFAESGFRELFYREGTTATILVGEETDSGHVFLSVNGKVDASSGEDMQTQILSAHLPLLLRPDSKDVLVVGLASGVTTGSVATHPVRTVEVVEIEDAVVQASHYFDDVNNRPLEDPRVRAVVNDGRNYLLYTDRLYDVIISEPSNPWLTGAANLFTREYFEILSRRLRPAGVACQWIQAYHMRPADLHSLIKTYASVFPHVLLFSLEEGYDLLLLGSGAPLRFDLEAMGQRLRLLDVAMDVRRTKIRSAEDILAWFVLGEGEIPGLVGDAPLNTDDNARVEFAAPLSLFKTTRKSNQEAFADWTVQPETYLKEPLPPGAASAAFHRGMADAWRRRGDLERAMQSVERALAVDPADALGLALKNAIAGGEGPPAGAPAGQ